MSKPKLFISHSTNGLLADDRCVRIRELLSETLTDWDVFVDKERIKAGDQWRTKILHHLAHAQAGIVLFSQKACVSDWVTAEALILCFRKSIDPHFQIIPVLLEGKSITDTCFHRYEPFQLNEIQFLVDDSATPAEAFVQRIIDRLNHPLPPEENRWVARVSTILRRIQTDTLRAAAQQLALHVEDEVVELLKDNLQKQLCRVIVEFMHHEAPGRSVCAFEELATELDQDGKRNLHYCLTAKWVENESAQIMLHALRRPEENQILTLNTGTQKVMDQYVNRILLESKRKEIACHFSVPGAAGEGDEAKIHRIEQAIREEIMCNHYYQDNDREAMPLPLAVQKQLVQENGFAICTLPSEYATESLLNIIRNRYQRIIFIVQVGDNNLSSLKAIGGRPLTPALTPDKYNAFVSLDISLSRAANDQPLR
jgi:hypothetical protein